MRVLDFLFPRFSLTGREGEWIAVEELRTIRTTPLVLDLQALRSRNICHLDRLVAAADYRKAPLLHTAVHTLNYRRVRAVSQLLGGMLAEAFLLLPWETSEASPVLCPVPLHWVRSCARGFNQAELLAQVVGARHQVPVRMLLARARSTGSQVGRNRSERLTALRNAFRMHPGEVPPRVILVDDVCTTGSTLDACAEVLTRAGAKRVEGLVLALG
jgi:ComF family protein